MCWNASNTKDKYKTCKNVINRHCHRCHVYRMSHSMNRQTTKGLPDFELLYLWPTQELIILVPHPFCVKRVTKLCITDAPSAPLQVSCHTLWTPWLDLWPPTPGRSPVPYDLWPCCVHHCLAPVEHIRELCYSHKRLSTWGQQVVRERIFGSLLKCHNFQVIYHIRYIQNKYGV